MILDKKQTVAWKTMNYWWLANEKKNRALWLSSFGLSRISRALTPVSISKISLHDNCLRQENVGFCWNWKIQWVKHDASAKEVLHETMGTCSVLTAYKIVNYISQKFPLMQLNDLFREAVRPNFSWTALNISLEHQVSIEKLLANTLKV